MGKDSKDGGKGSKKKAKSVGKLFVGIIEGDHLAAKDLNGLSDPYCVVQFESSRMKTDVKSETLKPKWEDEANFEFEVVDPTSQLLVSVFDKDQVGQDDFMGEVRIELAQLEDQKLHDAWFALRPRDDEEEEVSGELRLRLHYTFSAMSTFFAQVRVQTASAEDDVAQAPPEEFKVKVLVANIYRILAQIAPILDTYYAIVDWVTWERPTHSVIALIVFVSVSKHPSYIPALLPAVIAAYTGYQWIVTGGQGRTSKDMAVELAEKEKEAYEQAKDSGNIFDSLKYYEEWLGWLQGLIGWLADTIDGFKDLFNWSDPPTTLYVLGGLVAFMLLNLLVPFHLTLLVAGLYLFMRGSKSYEMGYILYARLWKIGYRAYTKRVHSSIKDRHVPDPGRSGSTPTTPKMDTAGHSGPNPSLSSSSTLTHRTKTM